MYGSLLDYLRWSMLLGKYTGLVPIIGLESTGEIPRFTWKSVWVLIYALSTCILTFMFGMLLYGFISSGFELSKLNPIIFFATYFLLSVLIFRFSKRFQDIITDVLALERLLPPARKPRKSTVFIYQLTLIVTFLGIGELLSINALGFYMAHLCFKLPKDSGWYLKSYFTLCYGWYLDFFPFSYITTTIFQIIRIQAGIMWFYGDLIIMVTSLYLKHRFEDFNRIIIDEYGIFTKNFKPSWLELQVHYTRLSKLVAILNKNLCATVFITYSANLYYICVEMYFILNSLTKKYDVQATEDCVLQHRNSYISTALRTHRLISQILRSSLSSYLASEVYVSSRKSLIAMHSIPTSAWNGDMLRLMTQIYYSKLGVSGLNFFLITRGMILATVAKILTYELVVVQF